jgi:hypothetical protein
VQQMACCLCVLRGSWMPGYHPPAMVDLAIA